MKLHLSPPIIKSPILRLFLVSFLILYLELVVIRFIPAQIRYIGYFSNVILLASFVGIGLGTIFWQKIKAPSFILPFTFLIFEALIGLFEYDLIVSSDQLIFFNQGFGRLSGEPVFLLPLIFFLVVYAFVLPGKMLGELFEKFEPLTAYAVNIGGSILGIVTFSLISFLGGGPAIWFLIIFLTSFLIISRPQIKVWNLAYLVIFFPLLFETNFLRASPLPSDIKLEKISWSPYYKISLFSLETGSIQRGKYFSLNVNNINHQLLIDPDNSSANPFYAYPYKLFPQKKFKDVLIVGAGTGNDVAKALNEGAENVVALEIDPTIVKLGKDYHPLKPYSSPKVKIVVNDARSYLAGKEGKFDVVIFALTDSLILSSANSNLRLESYLFTKESIQDAMKHLNDGGLVVLYNYYRSPWVVDKLASILRDDFGRDPAILDLTPANENNSNAAVLIGAESSVVLPASTYFPKTSTPAPTDDWPFLYLKERGIPRLYWSYLGIILFVLGVVFPLLIKKARANFDFAFFFLGAGFMLLETKNVVQFSLLFGSTWITNALVFTGLLTLVLLAILLSRKFPKINLFPLYILLFASLAMTYFYPQRDLLQLEPIPRFFIAVLINFAPVFLANVIFAQIFKNTKIAPLAYGANIFGSFVGGIFEYTSLIWGYQNLTILAALFYFFSLFFALRIKKSIV